MAYQYSIDVDFFRSFVDRFNLKSDEKELIVRMASKLADTANRDPNVLKQVQQLIGGE